MSNSDFCGCHDSLPRLALTTTGISEKLSRLRAEAERQARDWAKWGHEREAAEWEAVARWLGVYR